MKKIISQAFAPNTLLHGLLVAVVVAFGGVISPILESHQLPISGDLMLAGKAALIAGLGYIVKNGLFGSSQLNNSTNP